MAKFSHTYKDIISIENLLEAWKEFKCGKNRKEDVQHFELKLMDHIFALHLDLRNKTYEHGQYKHFKITDPKPRDIHKASVRDRLLHHALHRKLYPFFDRVFISDSFSCRLGKGTHRAMNRFRKFTYKASKNHTKTCFVLKCDIRKFFASIDQITLLSIIDRYIEDKDIVALINNIVGSFNSGNIGTGLPLGNLTSQLLVNIYMNEFDRFVKHKLKCKYYIRYADDFVILHQDRSYLLELISKISVFLREHLKLSLHPDKVYIKTIFSGVDFLGWIHFVNHRVLRTKTKRRMLFRCHNNPKLETVASYLGMLKHGNTHKHIDVLKPIYEKLLVTKQKN